MRRRFSKEEMFHGPSVPKKKFLIGIEAKDSFLEVEILAHSFRLSDEMLFFFCDKRGGEAEVIAVFKKWSFLREVAPS